MVSTIRNPSTLGAIGVDHKFDIQAPDGRIWFFTGNGVGPASIIPDALIIKLFGSGFWALHVGPLLFYTLLVLMVAQILYRLAGLVAVVLFHAFLFFYPHLSIFLAFEAMGEVPAMFYVLAAYLAFAWALKPQQNLSPQIIASSASSVANWKGNPSRHWLRFLAVGLVAGLALETKLISLWSLSGIFAWAGFLWLAGRRASLNNREETILKVHLVDMAGLVGGTILPIAAWELVQMAILVRLTNFTMYLQHLQQRITFILDDGSGVGLRIHSGADFFWDKFFMLSEIAHPLRWVTGLIFLVVLLGGLWLLFEFRTYPIRQDLVALLWIGWLANTIWFVTLAKTGWPRHFWFGLVLASMLLSIIAVTILRQGFTAQTSRRKILLIAASVLPLLIIVWGFVSQPHVWGFFVPDGIVPYWQQKQIQNKYQASLPWIITPRAMQAEVVDYIQHLPPDASVYYLEGYKVAEIPVQTGRIQYSLSRRPKVIPNPADVVIIGSSQISAWIEPVLRQELLQRVENQCPQPALRNDYYMICPIKGNHFQH